MCSNLLQDSGDAELEEKVPNCGEALIQLEIDIVRDNLLYNMIRTKMEL